MKPVSSKKILLIVGIVVLVAISAAFAGTRLFNPVPAGTGDVTGPAINADAGSEDSSNTAVTEPTDTANTGSETSSDISGDAAPTENADTAPVIFSGYFIDQDCFIAYEHPWEDNKDCLLMESCAASGYGVAVLLNDGSTNFYYFDGDFAPNASYGQIQAAKLINNTQTLDHIYIEVKGKLSGDKKAAANGLSYGIIKVSSMKEVPAPSTGQ